MGVGVADPRGAASTEHSEAIQKVLCLVFWIAAAAIPLSKDGSYPLVNDFYVVVRKSAALGSPERILFEWLQGPEGQALIESEGYVGIK